ncbi:hypothetical protein G8S49_11495 [Clostridium botulinum C]|uniref:Uncharacterized protein n=3 Tax=Clostridium botulinum TaxID=1491 RepID=A0A9N7AZ48_CLOBO|nr:MULTISPECIES: hypothetical protein [Clostridium]KMJ93068.1 hypothetical protein CBCST_p3CbCSt0032 [Clostridium botulinum C str. Stockholm]ACT33721.1 hypothetical protein CLG_A0034 [Clostridium botulinum D str. 1873]AYF55399.1 hypothetical protein DFH04_11750 [Clostridium novyi]AYF55439.1 hypothetical protein DFH04_12000 [Clostridium novyi]MBO3442138.1 hypothetical protein [Clostridium haemolyticum]
MITNLNTFQPNANDGFIRVYNRGAFISYFRIEYKLNQWYHELYSREIPVLQNDILRIPAGATDILFQVWVAVYFQTWLVKYVRRFSSPPRKCYRLSGVTFYTYCEEIPCPIGDLG